MGGGHSEVCQSACPEPKRRTQNRGPTDTTQHTSDEDTGSGNMAEFIKQLMQAKI
jgi:hypothetical protein